MNFFSLFKSNPLDSKNNFFYKIKNMFSNDDFSSYIDSLNDFLIESDVGVDITDNIIKQLKACDNSSKEVIRKNLFNILYDILLPCEFKSFSVNVTSKPFVILVCGTNGVGKTTTVVKIANNYKKFGKSVCVIAGDTYRSAAIEQLNFLCEKNSIPIIKQHYKADSSALIYDSLINIKKKDFDVVIIDTSGRLHTNSVLMSDLLKIKTTISKVDSYAPHEILMVIDTNVGQNAISQVDSFKKLIKVSALCLTKFDGSSKCGVIFNLAHTFSIPIKYICFGENIDDISTFKVNKFLEKLL